MFEYIILKFYLIKKRERERIKTAFKRSLINSKNTKYYRILVLENKSEQEYFILIRKSYRKASKKFRISN